MMLWCRWMINNPCTDNPFTITASAGERLTQVIYNAALYPIETFLFTCVANQKGCVSSTSVTLEYTRTEVEVVEGAHMNALHIHWYLVSSSFVVWRASHATPPPPCYKPHAVWCAFSNGWSTRSAPQTLQSTSEELSTTIFRGVKNSNGKSP